MKSPDDTTSHLAFPRPVLLVLGLAAYAAIGTEALSLFGGLNRLGILLLWFPVVVSGFKFRRALSMPVWPAGVARAVWVSGACLVVLTLGVTLVAPPNTWDSLTYHLARVAHWAEAGSVAHYPSGITRQLFMPPFAEYVILHLQLLLGSDWLAGLVQWLAYLGCAWVAAAIARKLGLNRIGQSTAAFFALSAPTAVIQASSTQNDLVTSLFLSSFILAWLGIREELDQLSAPTHRTLWAISLSFGLALLTKGTAAIYLFPWLLILLARRSFKIPRSLLTGLVVGGLVLSGPHWLRCYRTFGSPLGEPRITAQLKNTQASGLVSNVIRNLAVQISSPANTAMLENGIRAVLQGLGVDPDDPDTTWTKRFSVPAWNFTDEGAQSPFHFLLLWVAIGWILFLRKKLEPLLFDYSIAVALGFFLFSGLLKWQPFHSRLLLPLLISSAPAVAAVLQELSPRFQVGTLVVLGLSGGSALFLSGNRGIPRVLMEDRRTLYLPYRGATDYREALERIAALSCKEVGIRTYEDSWEYALWALSPPSTRFFHVLVTNPSAALFARQSKPCAILAMDSGSGSPLWIGDHAFEKSWEQGSLTLYVPR